MEKTWPVISANCRSHRRPEEFILFHTKLQTRGVFHMGLFVRFWCYRELSRRYPGQTLLAL